MERKLASIRTISDIQNIPDADMIELAIVDGWKVVVAKSVGHKVGDHVIYCEIDSFLPIKEEFEFLRKSSYKKMGDQEGFRLRTVKLRGQISQGLVLPISVLNPPDTNIHVTPFVGLDVTEMLGIIKYEPPIPAELAGKMKGGFPSFIPKTDEERIQNMVLDYEDMKQHDYYETEKLDGTSTTYFLNQNEFGVCGKNWELYETEGNTFWKLAREMDIENKLKQVPYNVSIQGETIGEGIQGNPYKLKGQTVKFYNVFNIDTHEYLGLEEFKHILSMLGLDTVPIITTNFKLPYTVEEMIKSADGKSVLNPSANREGIVVRSLDRKISFKVISNKFLLDEK
jgi:RNA ligase (TIGR02306 family)